MKFRNTVIKKVILLSLILSFGCAGIFGIIGDGNAQATSTSSFNLNLPDKSISDIIEDLINWILTIAVVIAIIMLIVGGMLYIMAAGDETRILLAKKIVTYAILGLLVIGLSYVIVKQTADVIEGNYTSSTSPPEWASCGDSITFNYKGGSVTYGTVLNPTTNECWLDRNLGASQVATAYNDSAAYGDSFQWGRLDDGHQTRTSGTTSTNSTTDNPGHSNFILEPDSPYDWRVPQNNSLWQGASGINNPCPSGWRIPTETEWNAERLSWGSNNYNGAYTSPLKLVAAGRRVYSNGSFGSVDSGLYWSSMVSGTRARLLTFYSSGVNMSSLFHADGFSVRCIKD